jgi:hypothetical protein
MTYRNGVLTASFLGSPFVLNTGQHVRNALKSSMSVTAILLMYENIKFRILLDYYSYYIVMKLM